MDENVLGRIIDVEKRLQERLREERLKAGSWLDEVKRETEKTLLCEEEKIKAGYAVLLEKATEETGRDAARILSDAVRESQSYAEISDGVIDEIVREHIRMILPEEQVH